MPFKCTKCNRMTALKSGSWCPDCKGAGTAQAETVPNGAVLTKIEVETRFGNNCSKRYKRDEYWGGDANEFHVHDYSGPGAHVKCSSTSSPKLLDSGQNKFYEYGWNDVAAGVKLIKAGTGSGQRSAVCGAIILFLMENTDLSNLQLRAKLGELADACS